MHSKYTLPVPSPRKRSLEVMRSRLEGVVGWEFIDSFGSVDELRDGRRCSKVSDPLRRHDLLDGMLVLDKSYDPHLCFTCGALQRVYFVYALYARGPRASPELPPIVALCFFLGRRRELSAFPSAPRRIPSVIPCD